MFRLLCALFALGLSFPASAQSDPAANYPNRAVRVIVPFPAGGPTDIYARMVADKLRAAFGQPFVVENRPGGTGTIGNVAAINAPADGYTLVFGSNSSQVVSTLLRTKPPFDPLKDLEPISMLLHFALLLVVNNDVQANSVSALVALVKNNPGKMNIANVGTGSGGLSSTRSSQAWPESMPCMFPTRAYRPPRQP